MKRRFISMLLALSMIFTLLPAQAFAAGTSAPVDTVNPFEDVRQGSWYYDAVQYVRVNGLFYGTSKTTFLPEGTMTRGMFVTVLGRMAGVNPDNYAGPSAFTDVPGNAYYAPYVAWAAKYGITTGTGSGKFSPDAYINRQEMAVFFVRYFETFGVDYEANANTAAVPADIGSVSPWARDAVLKLWRTGLFTGNGETFGPFDSATRAQAATVCCRTDETVATWYSEPGVPSTRVRINPATGLPYDNGDTPAGPSTPTHGNGGGSGGSGVSGGAVIDSITPSDSYAINFYDSSDLIETLYAKKGEPLGKVPAVEKSSKADAVLTGYYTDPEFTQPFYADDPVERGMNVYAKYEPIDGPEEVLTPSSFARMDQRPDLSFTIRRVSGNIAAGQAAALKVMDGTDPVEIAVTESGGAYTVSAPAGFNEGCTYELTLAEGWVFVNEDGTDKPDSIRTATFSIKMEEVRNLRMNSAIKYVRDSGENDSADLTFTIKGEPYDVLNTASVSAMGENGTGSFTYANASNALQAGDILCVYMGTQPDQRCTGAEANDPAAYVKVREVNGDTVTFGALDGKDQQNLYEIPDNFPLLLNSLPEGGNTVSINSLDTEMYAIMMGKTEGTLEKARERLSVGDFVTLYTAESFREQTAVYGRVESIIGDDITYTPTTEYEMLHSMDLYDQLETADGDEWVSEDLQRELELQIQEQVEQSGFAEEAAGLLWDVASATDSFQENVVVQRYLLQNGNASARSGGMGGFTLANRPKVTVKLLTRGGELHFQGGVQLQITIEARYRVPIGDSGNDFLAIDLNGSFVEEVALSPIVKASLVKEKVWFIPVIKGVQLNAILDVKNYTAFDFNAEIFTMDREGLIKGEKSRITSELENMGKSTSKAEYQESLSRLMERFTEVVSRDSDWITLLEQKFLDQEKCVYGFCFGVKGHFVIQTNMSIAIGSSLEYETGKRYTFWFKVGLFTPTSGSSVTDLIDERFGFQFYVMGKLGMKLGVKLKIYAGIGTEDFASAGLTAEVGPYIKLWGFFIYTCNKYRPVNSTQTARKEQMAGALDLELGMYASVGYEATALKIFTYSDDFESWEIPILHTGTGEFCYDCFYHPEPDESVRFQNNTGSPGGNVMKITDYARTLKCITLENGYWYWNKLPVDRFSYSLSNSNFQLDTSTGELLVTVTPPEGVHYMKCDLTVTYKGGKMAFSTYDISTTVPLVWTDLSDRELKEYHTASVRVGNDTDGYNTVWTKKVLLGEEFDLPGEAEVRELAGWNDLKYVAGTGYGNQALNNQVITQDTVFDYNTALRTYSVTVTGIGGINGSGTKTYTAKYGDAFDFSDLNGTGGAFEKFTQVTTVAEITVDEEGSQQTMDLTRPIGPAMAQALQGGVTAKANYVDDSVTAYFTFTGVELEQIAVKTRRGTAPETAGVYSAVAALGIPSLAVRDITPAVGPIDSDTNFTVDCIQLSGARAELHFVSNGGTETAPMDRLAGSLVTGLPQPERTGYTFGGWYMDSSLTGGKVESLIMPEGGGVLYAKWTPNTYQVSFHVNGGTSGTPDAIEAAYGGRYGDLPTVRKTGERFLGWFTAQTGGEQVNSGDLVTITGNQTLYAHWGELLTIGTSGNIFSVTPAPGGLVYNRSDQGGQVTWTLNSEATDSAGNFVPTEGYQFEFVSNNTITTDNRPINAGTYDLKITRPADDTYASFEEVHTGVITIGKADWKTDVWESGKCTVKVSVSDDSYIEVQLDGDSGFMLDEVLAGTAPGWDIEGVWEGGAGTEGSLLCRLLSFNKDPAYGVDYYQGLGNVNLTGKNEFKVTLYIPASRNYNAVLAPIEAGTYPRS